MTAHASIAEINQLIAQRNPFNRELATRKEEVWTGISIDYPAINSHVSQCIFRTINEIKDGQRKVAGITIKAEKGLGKTHVISRLRNQLKDTEGNIFIFIADYNDLDNIKEEFLGAVASSLNHEGSQGVKQCQVIATAFLNESFGKDFSPQKWVANFSKVIPLMDKVINKCLKRHSFITEDPDVLRAVLWTLSPSTLLVSQACNWLSGKNISSSAAAKLDLPAEQNNFNAFERVCLLLGLISAFYQVVVCFDQTEGTEISQNAGFTKPQIIANLAMDLYNSINRGIILFGVYPDIWNHQIRALPAAEAVIDRIGEQIIELRGLSSDDVVGLVSVWLNAFYQNHGLIPENELYPFSEDELRTFGKQRATVRDVLQWCQKNWKVPEDTISHPEVEQDKSEIIKSAFDKVLLGLEIDDFIENKEKISQALRFSFEQIVGQEIDGFIVDKIEDIQPRSYNANWIDFKIDGHDNGQFTSIGIATIQDSYGRGVQACLKRLIDYEQFGLTRGCLLRSKKISSSASKAQEYLQELLNKGGEWVLLKKEEILPLFALYEIYRHREDEFTEEDLSQFIQESEIIKNNLLIREILSDPSGLAPEDAEDEEAILDAEVEDFEDLEDSEDLAELDQDLGSDDFAEDELGDVSDLEAAELSI